MKPSAVGMWIKRRCKHMVACNIGDIKSGMTMHTNNKLLDEIEQRALAERVLLNILRATLTRPGAMDNQNVAMMMSVASTERERHGDYKDAALLGQWKTLVDGWT